MSGEQSAPMAEGMERRRTILVVEDEVLVRLAAASHLRDAGYTVIEAVNADEAMRVIASEPVDLMFSDVNLPGAVDGYDLAVRIAQEHPRLKVLLTSGRGAPQARTSIVPAYLGKPYKFSELGQRIADLLAE
jgi:CheY-like chemotaxis protein